MANAPVDHTRPLESGAVIQGEYRIERLLGEGGYGAVYAATQLNLGRRVALKVLHPEVVARGAARERFRREAQLAQSLSHPNTVRLFDFGETDGRPFIIYEYLDGQSLDAVLAREGPFSPQRTARVAAQTLKALMEAHAKGIVHRDIKPGNIFICNFDGEPDFVKVLDFGIASAGEALRGPTLTGEGMTVGTPAYMAPEQALAEELDGRADLYSVGLVMSELLSGKQVYAGESLMRIVMAQASPERPPLAEEAIRSPLGPVIQRATAKKRELRFPNGRAMLDMIEATIAKLGSGSGPSHGVAGAYAPPPQIQQALAPTGYAMPSASSSFRDAHQTGPAQPQTQPAHPAQQGYGAPPAPMAHHAPPGYPPAYPQQPYAPALPPGAPPTTLGGASAPVQAPAVAATPKKRSTALVFAIGFLACAAVAGGAFGIWYAVTPAEPASTKSAKTPKGTPTGPVIIITRGDKTETVDADDIQEPDFPDFQIPDFPSMSGIPGVGKMDSDFASTSYFKWFGHDAKWVVDKLQAEGVSCTFSTTMDLLGKVSSFMCTEQNVGTYQMQLSWREPSLKFPPCGSPICEGDTSTACAITFLVNGATTPRAKDLLQKLKK